MKIRCECSDCCAEVEFVPTVKDIDLYDLCENILCEECIELWRDRCSEEGEELSPSFCPVGKKICELYAKLGKPCMKGVKKLEGRN